MRRWGRTPSIGLHPSTLVEGNTAKGEKKEPVRHAMVMRVRVARHVPFRRAACGVFRRCASTKQKEVAETQEGTPPLLSGREIRNKFLEFFEERGHRRLPSSSLVPEDPTVLLTIAGMLQFKPIFLGQMPREFPRVTTTQKCIRTKDIDNVGVTARHHTFFEMLGNFSFGDYFKREAIEMAWELSTEVFCLPKERLWISVFREDDEAYNIWKDEVGIPESRIVRMGEEDNFWASGPTGPCGPCSELYYDMHPERGMNSVDLDDGSRFIEFYNLVFMESNRLSDGRMVQLQNKNIDTGMGLERMAQILQRVANNYETDLIFPIVSKAAALAGVDYGTCDSKTKVSLKVIGDHIRAAVYLISDGVNASNMGRGYILRRLIRRVVRSGRLIGIQGDGCFTPSLAVEAIKLSSDCDPTVHEKEDLILEELRREEERFSNTLDRGEKLLEELLATSKASSGILTGKDAFLLYDTFGFPLEITQDAASELGVAVDTAGFEQEMAKQRRQSRAARQEVDLTKQASLAKLAENLGPTLFVGYHELEVSSTVEALLVDGEVVHEASEGDIVEVILNTTCFYAESGGQVGDHGSLSAEGVHVSVTDCQKVGGSVYVHLGSVEVGKITTGMVLTAQVDQALRKKAITHHSATHLLQSALKEVLGDNVAQKGSLVGFDRLRFDFNFPKSVASSDLETVEETVNKWIAQNIESKIATMEIEEAKKMGALATFGEKYGSTVRVVEFEGASIELCGGCHVENTAEIGAMKIISESGIASGIRRIEAVAGPSALEYLSSREQIVRDVSLALKVRPEELPNRVQTLQQEYLASKKEVEDLKAELALLKSEKLLESAIKLEGGQNLLVNRMDGINPTALSEAAQNLQKRMGDNGAVVLGSASAEGKVNLVAAFGPAIVSAGANAGKVVGEVAKTCGGGGGGRPNLAQAGGRDATKLTDALEQAKETLVRTLPHD